MYFDDLHVGLRRDLGSYAFTAENIKAFARQFDPQPYHLDEEAGRIRRSAASQLRAGISVRRA